MTQSYNRLPPTQNILVYTVGNGRFNTRNVNYDNPHQLKNVFAVAFTAGLMSSIDTVKVGEPAA